MTFGFPAPPTIDGCIFLEVKPVVFADRRTGRRDVFPVYLYSEDATGELTLVTEPRYEEVLDKLIAMGAFGTKGGQG